MNEGMNEGMSDDDVVGDCARIGSVVINNLAA